MKMLHLGLAIAVTLPFADASLAGSGLEVRKIRPQRIGLKATIFRAVDGFHTPLIYTVTLRPDEVNALLPNALAPRLDRPETGLGGKLRQLSRSEGFIRWVRDALHSAEKPTDIVDDAGVAGLFREERSPHTFTISSDGFAFAETGPELNHDVISKHVMIATDFKDVRFAGQFWREGSRLCYNGNSGTYMKHRKEAGLNRAPKDKAALPILQPIFEPSLKVELCGVIAPHFGSSEALDQGEKAITSAELAEAAIARDPSAENADELLAAAVSARQGAEEAFLASRNAAWKKKDRRKHPEIYAELDRQAAEAAYEAKRRRKVIEKILGIDED
jgi:hypothetical protein